MKIDRNEVVRLLERLSNAKGPSGFEDEVIDVVRDFCDGWATVEENTLRDGLIVPSGTGLDGDRARPRVMMDAHGDEVGGMVRTIRANGTMGFVTLGRFPEGALCGQDVLVRNARGEWLHGTIGVKPPHFTSAAEKAAHVPPEMILDVGATSAEEARERFFLRIGEPFVVATQFSRRPVRRRGRIRFRTGGSGGARRGGSGADARSRCCVHVRGLSCRRYLLGSR